ncbi:MAG TPA: hypothetical protein VD947_03045 [Patescibacteria group bacterium]|nr:hypothetical protein [Patescibacteria group bacterium]
MKKTKLIIKILFVGIALSIIFNGVPRGKSTNSINVDACALAAPNELSGACLRQEIKSARYYFSSYGFPFKSIDILDDDSEISEVEKIYIASPKIYFIKVVANSAAAFILATIIILSFRRYRANIRN